MKDCVTILENINSVEFEIRNIFGEKIEKSNI